MDATFCSAETVDGGGNCTNSEARDGSRGIAGTNDITPGDVVPLSPRHTFKFHVEFSPIKRLTLGVEGVTASGMYARGNENNQHQPDGVYYLGPGKTDAYTTFAIRSAYLLPKGMEVFVWIDNLFDKRYATSAQLAGTGFDPNGNFVARPLPAVNGAFPVRRATFYSPGAPRGIYGGVQLRF